MGYQNGTLIVLATTQLSSILLGIVWYPIESKILFFFWGIVFYKWNIILLGSTTKKTLPNWGFRESLKKLLVSVHDCRILSTADEESKGLGLRV